MGVTFVGFSSMLGSVNYMTTIINMRAPGMTLFRMPMTIWAMFITAILQAFALPVLTAAGFMLLFERTLGMSFFTPGGLVINNAAPTVGGGQALLWQHLFWFYSHPAVYIMILPAMGMVSDMISCFSRKPLFGYRPMVYAIAAIAGLGFIVWGHHMFTSGMNPALGMTFMVSTMMIALPSAVKTFNWLGTMWGGNIQFTVPMLNSIGFVAMFVVGGLSGIFMAAVPVDIHIHDTYYIVAHFHYVLFGATVFGVFGAIHFWFPKMFGRMMNETVGQAALRAVVHRIQLHVFPDAHAGGRRLSAAAGRPVQLSVSRTPAAAQQVHHVQRTLDGVRAVPAALAISSTAFSRARKSGEIPGMPTVSNGRRRRLQGTGISTFCRSCTADRTNMRRRSSTEDFLPQTRFLPNEDRHADPYGPDDHSSDAFKASWTRARAAIRSRVAATPVCQESNSGPDPAEESTQIQELTRGPYRL